MKNPIPHYLALLLLAALIGCASLGLPSPESFNERLATGYSTVTETRTTATTLLTAGKITADDAQNIQAQADNARAGLDIARSLSKTDIASANTRLTAITTALTALQAYLTAQGGK